MNIKKAMKNMSGVALVLFALCNAVGIMAMRPTFWGKQPAGFGPRNTMEKDSFVSPAEPGLRPIDQVFLNECYHNKPLEPILKMKPNINAVHPKTGYTGLHYVCLNGDVSKVQLLLDNGADINRRAADGASPLSVAFGFVTGHGKNLNASERYEIARFLIEHGADVWAMGNNNQSILYLAVRTGDIRSVKLVIEAMERDKKKDWRIIPNIGLVALYEAIVNNKEDICLLLLEAGVPIKNSVKTKSGLSFMHLAGGLGNKHIIQALINRGLSIDTPDDSGRTVLHYMSEEGTAEGVKTLLDLGANPQIRDKNGKTPFELAHNNPDKEVREILLQATESAKSKSSVPILRPIDEVFLNACYNNKPLEAILKMKPNINAVEPATGYTGLHYVCMNGDLSKAQLLLDNGADINRRAIHGENSLYATFASSIGAGKDEKLLDASQRYEMARFLIEHGADIWATGNNNQSILYLAVRTGDIRSVKLVIEAMERNRKRDWKTIPNIGYEALYEAIANEKEDICSLLLEVGVPVKSTQKIKDGVSLMHIAAAVDNKRIIQELINRGLSIDTPDDDGQTALHYASERGTAEGVKTLLDLGANPEFHDKNGKTPFELAHNNPDKEVREILLQATESAKSKPSAPILRPIDEVFLNACYNNKPLEAILKMKPNINAVDPTNGYTGLHYVCMNGDLSKAQLLLDNGADINRRAIHGENSLYATFASSIGAGKDEKLLDASQRYEMARFLIEHGADIWATGNNNQSILEVAVIRGDIRSVKLLIEAMNRDKEVREILRKAQSSVPKISAQSVGVAVPVQIVPNNAQTTQSKKSKRKARQELLTSKKAVPIENAPVPEIKIDIPQEVKLSEVEKAPYVQDKVSSVLTPKEVKSANLAKTYASLAGNSSPVSPKKPEEKFVTIIDDHITITVAIPPHLLGRLGIMSNQDNRLAKITNYSAHVEEKRNNPHDFFHNFSPEVEKSLGLFAKLEIIKGPTKEHSSTIQYTIPASIMIYNSKPIEGTFEFVVRDGQMQHRFFKRTKKEHKKEKLLSLTPPSAPGESSKSLSQ